MEQQNQPAPAPVAPPTAPVATPAPAAPQAPAPAKSTPVWAWILGGCFGIIILGMLVSGGLAWWAAKKIKNEIKNAQPKLDQWQKNAEKVGKEVEKMGEEAEKWQKEMEKIQDQMPPLPDNSNTSLE